MSYDIVDVADLDCIYLSYDEPQKEEFWLKIKNMVPWAKRVDGVKGSDAAHKAAAEASDTERFILIDGDNIPSRYIQEMMEEITKYGTPTIKRIYGDWTNPHLSKWKNVLLDIEVILLMVRSYQISQLHHQQI